MAVHTLSRVYISKLKHGVLTLKNLINYGKMFDTSSPINLHYPSHYCKL